MTADSRQKSGTGLWEAWGYIWSEWLYDGDDLDIWLWFDGSANYSINGGILQSLGPNVT